MQLMMVAFSTIQLFGLFAVGMGADLFESFVGSIIAAIQLADSPGRSVSDPVWCGLRVV